MTTEIWASPTFLDEVAGWVAEHLPPDLGLTGRLEQPHARAWSSAIRFETTTGQVWFKVNGSGSRYEPALLQVLQDRVPALLPEVLATDVERGWSLSRDGGPLLRAVLPADRSWVAWQGVVARYAEAQLQLAGAREPVLATGVREVTPGTVPGLARALVEELAGIPTAAGGLGPADVTRISAVLPQLDDWCAELSSSGIPDSVQHDDLHSGNVCWNGSPTTARIIDWGDATWGCPLTTMLATLNSVAFHAGLYVEGQPIDAPQVLRVRDAYLEPFTRFASRDELVHLVDLARRTGCVGKALSYRAALRDAGAAGHAAMDFPVREWLLGLLDP